ncbi:dihydrolipoamide acetyltransferase family protein [Aeromonas simiae]|uniref:dihydrolipoamide acetyltransferase family protein n=1 Tax=Aeromonas simiae TaxID=218936 RepID=UPI00266D26BB|nr:dihydrolipoamide acetyltransferase family protein [Aeromonas simiae]MDO2946848.1 2-oxo acid dehydrogenase subunit E2 [Aeromonas simiae]MDO2951351.1 2-oxo acid dehydrogenase subunit E2 [Aeromonas simiae]MDO2954558.1 2-oxo acid dehydrogenase subunit E2 [Aeromonas simiae]
MKFFKLPDLGEGLAEAEIVEWKVKAGERVEVDQVLLSVETAKALVDVPSPVAGVIAHLCAAEGDILHIGAPLVEFEGGEDDGTVVGKVLGSSQVFEDHFVVGAVAAGSGFTQAMPAVRRLALQLGVDINGLKGSGAGGLVTEMDVQQAFEAQEGSHNEVLKGARRAMAKAMALSHQSVVPVSITDEVDLRAWRADEDVTVRLIQAIGVACRGEPSMNAWFDGDTLTRRLFDEVNVAIAVDSKHGLYVPVMENVAQRTVADLRAGLDRMIADVKARAVPREMLQGATITLTNFGAIAGRYASPVVSPPQVTIVGAGKLFEKVVFVHGEARPVRALPLSVTFDHRACTGGEAARFLRLLVDALEAPEK